MKLKKRIEKFSQTGGLKQKKSAAAAGAVKLL